MWCVSARHQSSSHSARDPRSPLLSHVCRTKFAGIKQFTVFRVTDTRTKVTVDRRFKHFTWLHEQLVRIHPHFMIPQLPGKQVSGRFEQEFVERRRRGLQRFLDRIAKHPVLGSSAVLLHFLTADDHKNWKAGKRLSEQIPPVSNSIEVKGGGEQVDAVEILARTSSFMEWLSKRLVGWHDAGEDLSASFHMLAAAFEKMGVVLMQFSGPAAGQPECVLRHHPAHPAVFALQPVLEAWIPDILVCLCTVPLVWA